uniref:Septin 12 n=2 Tax=Fundulus heteroclitus TaxID=8078 RepID=A0A3Q2P687_FUNHE
MSDLPVNDHLAGILSDFEALKRSFDDDSVDDMTSVNSASSVSTPISPSSSHFILNHNKPTVKQGGGGQSPALDVSINSMGFATDSHICLSSSLSPVLKTRAVGSSLSFNRGTMNRPIITSSSSSVTRAASFQSRLNPNFYSTLSGPGSDNDSLYSSTSSLEYSSGGGYTIPANKLTSYHSPQPQREYYGSKLNWPQQREANVFKSEVNQGQELMQDNREPRGLNHGTMSILDFQFPVEGKLGIPRDAGEGRLSPGIKPVDANSNWNGLHSGNSFEEGGSKEVSQQRLRAIKNPLSKAKETPRLNKFPLDLDSLVSSISPASSAKPEARLMSPKASNRSLQSINDHQNYNPSPPSTAASPSASLSSLDSSSDTPVRPYNYQRSPTSPSSPVPSHHPITVPEMGCSPVPLSSAENLQMDNFLQSQGVHMVPNLQSQFSSSSTYYSRGIQSLEGGECNEKDSVDLILQRIALFSLPATTNTITGPAVQTPAGLSSKSSCPTETRTMTTRKEGNKNHGELAEKLLTEPPTLMEERGENQSVLMGEEQMVETKNQEQQKKHCVEDQKEPEETGKEKGMGIEEKESDLEAAVKMELCQSVPGLQTSFIRGTDLFGYVGIEAVLDQMRHKTMKAGFEFNIMVVGQSGLGKSTLVNTLFKSKVSRKSCTPNFEDKISKTVKLHAVSHVIEEKGVKMKLTVIDTPGFGDQINNENCWEPIVKYVNEQYEKYLREELNINRKRRIPDSRVHCCIYFLPATGHRLRPIDLEFMKRLGKIVSIVPVIAKADTLTVEERQEFKERIRQDLASNGIRVYPQREYDEDPEERILNDRIRESIPFAVVGTDKEHQVNGNKVLGRKTKWGIIEVENVAHCEFANLRDLLIRSHLQDLKDVTHNIHYETYRVRRLNESNMNFSELVLSNWPLKNGTDICETESQL